MQIALIAYVINVITSTGILCVVLLVGSLLTYLVTLFVRYAVIEYSDREENLEQWNACEKVGNRCLVAAFITGALLVAIPSKTTMYVMASGVVLEQIAQLDEVQELGSDAAQLARTAIEALRQNLSQSTGG